ncbi:MAG: hypothetical protein EBS34_10570, partial [Flavobacteriales bacterium]|nr:hypothetical protein [Flavobacteriales bacterium]
EECSKLTDLSTLAQVENLRHLDIEKFLLEVPVIQYLTGLNITDLYLRSTVSDLSNISKCSKLNHLTLNGNGSSLEELPEIPKIITSFGLEGFPNLKSASFLVNLDPTIRIRWWGPKKIAGLPANLRSHEAFKDIELLD